MTSNCCRRFLIAEGLDGNYPHYGSSHITISDVDPAKLDLNYPFVSSPIFKLEGAEDGFKFSLKGKMRICFLMVPKVFPTFERLLMRFKGENLWFSLGLSNLIIFDESEDFKLSDSIIAFLVEESVLHAHEFWTLLDNSIVDHDHVLHKAELDGKVDFINDISESLPLHLKFSVSECILSVKNFLYASRRFTPQYYDSHLKTINNGIKPLVQNLTFLQGDIHANPTQLLISQLGARDKEDAIERLKEPTLKEKIEALVNDLHGRLIQFNSSMSYMYSQAYSGTFPLFDHFGIIKRYSLLGVGSAIAALHELVTQIEKVFYYLPFEDLNTTSYATAQVPKDFLKVFSDPSEHDVILWQNDPIKQTVISQKAAVANTIDEIKTSEKYYNRLAFYSGRLGFREYDLSATAAIHVLVEAHSLKWNVINYSHEIIHNHVRVILNQNLLNVPEIIRNIDNTDWLEEHENLIVNATEGKEIAHLPSYKKYFTMILINFSVQAKYFGSLSFESDKQLINELRVEYVRPQINQVQAIILQVYKDINEIFVHVMDFAYIYKRDVNPYLMSIWASWSTVQSVASDLKQYVIRSLLVIGVNLKGTPVQRYKQSKSLFLELLPQIEIQNTSYIFSQIQKIFESQASDKDIKNRFFNCILVADMAYHFFVGRVESIFDNGDECVLPKISGMETEEENDTYPAIYDLETNSFKDVEIRSKVRFVLDQVLREINRKREVKVSDDEMAEKISSWLLLSLSSYYN